MKVSCAGPTVVILHPEKVTFVSQGLLICMTLRIYLQSIGVWVSTMSFSPPVLPSTDHSPDPNGPPWQKGFSFWGSVFPVLWSGLFNTSSPACLASSCCAAPAECGNQLLSCTPAPQLPLALPTGPLAGQCHRSHCPSAGSWFCC